MQKLTDELLQQRKARISRYSNDNDPIHPGWRKTSYVGKIQVQRDQTSLLGTTHFVKMLIRTSLQPFFADCLNLVSCGVKESLGSGSEVLVKLELHAGTPTRIST